MTNIKEKAVDSGDGTDYTNFRIRTKLLSTSGAGVNANSSVNLAFATADPLSELVWLPHNGLSLKCANPGADERRPFLLWNVGPSSMQGYLPPLQSGGDTVVDQGNPIVSQTVRDADDMIDNAVLVKASENHQAPELGPSHGDGSESERKMEEEAEDKDEEEENCMVNREADSCHRQTVETDESRKDIAAIVPATPFKKMESSAENDLLPLTEKGGCGLGGVELLVENGHQGEGSCIGSRRKGKALSDGDIYRRSSGDQDDSAESSNSTGHSSKGMKSIKRKICDEGAILGSKKMKKQIHGSTFVMKHDSSFMKWISNMTKGGRLDPNKEDSLSPLPLACANDAYKRTYRENFICFKPLGPAAASRNMGFQAVFQSLYCRETDESSTEGGKIVESVEFSRENMVNDGKLPEIPPGSPSANIDHLAKDTASDRAVRGDALGKEMKIAAKEAYPDATVAQSGVVERSKPYTSLWITRLSTNTLKLEKGKEIAEENIGCSTNLDSQVSFEVKPVSELCPVLPSQRFSSEAMASVFARRLDALRHITTSKKGIHLNGLQACLFCGGCHDVRECPSVTKCELKDLLLKLSTFDCRVEESSCLCIRCSQSDHWAVSCPVAPSSRQRILDEKAPFGVRHLQLDAGSGRCEGGGDRKLAAAARADCSSRKPPVGSFPIYQTWNLKISSRERTPASSERRRSSTLKPAKDVEDNRSFPLSAIANLQNTVAWSEMFDAIRNLRLTRADIIRWMNSDVPLSHLNGFFLRLRLRNHEAGLGGGSYYVACITGDVRENNGCSSRKSISVDVGGMKSSVATRYVSNHEFLEDEIKAWWSRTVGSGCKIPSLAELNSKFNERQALGF